MLRALELLSLGHNQTDVSRILSISRGAVKDWDKGLLPDFKLRNSGQCDKRCGEQFSGPTERYTYLLGL